MNRGCTGLLTRDQEKGDRVRRRLSPRLPVAGLLGALWLAGAVGVATADAFQETPCANFGEVGPGLYRGAEPDEGCLAHLARQGIRTVVNLRDEEEASELEQAKVVALGMQYVNMPMSGFDRPSVAQVQRVLTVVCGPENRPVFLHCKRGRDRTGVIVAAHRMAHEGWAAERAMQEAKGFGLAWWQFRMKQFIRDFLANASLRNPGRPAAGSRRSRGRSGRPGPWRASAPRPDSRPAARALPSRRSDPRWR